MMRKCGQLPNLANRPQILPDNKSANDDQGNTTPPPTMHCRRNRIKYTLGPWGQKSIAPSSFESIDNGAEGERSLQNLPDISQPRRHRSMRELKNQIVTDAGGNYVCCKGNVLHRRYEVTERKPIGSGSFGVVVCAMDILAGREVAIKLVKAVPKFVSGSEQEIRILQALHRNACRDSKSGAPSHEGVDHVVQFFEGFMWNGHPCLVFERLSHSLFDVLKFRRFRGFNLDAVQNIARQIVSALSYLREVGVVHCDLKPENILLDENPAGGRVKIIDFGCSVFHQGQHHHRYVQSRWYRAPEVILGATYGCPIDMWSLGCILAELYKGTPLFPGGDQPTLTSRSDHHDMLLRFVELLGPLPRPYMATVTVHSQVSSGGSSGVTKGVDCHDDAAVCHTTPTGEAEHSQPHTRSSRAGRSSSSVSLPRVISAHTPAQMRPSVVIRSRRGEVDMGDEGFQAELMRCAAKNVSPEALRGRTASVLGLALTATSEKKAPELARKAAFLDFLLRLLVINQSDRIDPDRAKIHRFVKKLRLSSSSLPPAQSA